MKTSTMGVVGSGIMGAGIAQVGLMSGLNVILYDVSPEASAKARTDIVDRLKRLVAKGQLTAERQADAERRLTLASSLSDFRQADVVIEAIVERLEPKRSLFRELEAVVPAQTILASNTSSLSVAAIGAQCAHKERVCGLHFFNPVPLMKLVEVITTPDTSSEVTEAAISLAKALGKTPVAVKDGPGFLVNLGGRALVTEGLHIAQEGVADLVTIDRIVREGAGFRMGPFELMDLTGIDVNFPVVTFIYEGFQHDPRLKTTTLHASMFNSGRFGRKVGRGYYRYDQATEAPPDSVAEGRRPSLQGVSVALPERTPELMAFCQQHHLDVLQNAQVSLVAPLGEDAATVAARLGIHPSNLVAIDLIALDRQFVTLMAPVGSDRRALGELAEGLRGGGLRVEVIRDSPGFVVQRILAMIANLGCEMAQIGIGTPEDIDLAMRLALNYPRGPLEFAAAIGPQRTHAILTAMQSVTGSDRYRPSLWLRRRALLGRPIHERD